MSEHFRHSVMLALGNNQIFAFKCFLAYCNDLSNTICDLMIANTAML